jgi:hypothetical protein
MLYEFLLGSTLHVLFVLSSRCSETAYSDALYDVCVYSYSSCMGSSFRW